MRILSLIEGANEVCCRYRIEAFRDALADQNMELEVVALKKGVWGRLGDLRRAVDVDIVILQRKLLPIWQIALLRKWSNRLVFDIDDAVFQRDSNSRKGPISNSRMSRFRAMVAKADAVFAGNGYLRQAALKYTSPERAIVVPTCVDPSKYRPAKHIRNNVDARLMWIGQSSTLETLGTADGYLTAIARRLPNMEFRQICDRSSSFQGLKIAFRPWSRETEAAELAEGDIGIAYMPDDSWSLGKCGLKVLQYMAAGLPVVANSVGVHREMVIHGQTGFLADTPDEWAEAVHRLASQPELRAKLGTAGRKLIEDRYNTAVWGPRFAEYLGGLPAGLPLPLRKVG
jgi:glycosyltransferase involved in cell wall biosynthesis